MHDAAASFTHEKARKFDKEIKIENKSYKTKHNVINLKQEMQAFLTNHPESSCGIAH